MKLSQRFSDEGPADRNDGLDKSTSYLRRTVCRVSRVLACVLIVGSLMTTRAFAQTAEISGTIIDSSGASVPNAGVTALNVGTGISQSTESNSYGYYLIPLLEVGNYTVTAQAKGFETQIRSGVSLSVGAQQVLNITMQVGSVTQSVEVNGAAPIVELGNAAIADVVNEKTTVELPLNGRDWTSLAALQPGVNSLATDQAATNGYDREVRGYGAQVTISGSRPQFNNYRIDGISVNDQENSGPGSVEGATLGVDAIQEFSVLTTNYSAEYGRTAGGIVNAITKSGTNSFHGDAYEFLRNSALDARNYFDPATIPEFRRNQFGGSLGGPIRADRTFFFADFEGLRENQGVTSLLTVPSSDARNGIIHNTNGTTTIIAVNPLVQPFFALWGPVNDGLFAPGNTGEYRFTGAQITSENFVTGRVDHKFSDEDSISSSYEYDAATLTLPDPANEVLVGHKTGRQLVSIEETHIFNSRLLNRFEAGYNRTVTTTGGIEAINPAASNPALGTHAPQDNPQISVSGLGTIQPGLNVLRENNYWQNDFQGHDDVLLTKGIQSLKFGVNVERVQVIDLSDSTRDGAYTFGSLTAFLQNEPKSLKAELPGQLVLPYVFLTTVFGTYIQDDIRLRPNLTVNLGLRYEMDTGISEASGRLASLYNVASPVLRVGNPAFNNPTLRNFAPRVGFAWDPFKDGKTSLRGGFGIFDVLPLPYMVLSNTNADLPFFEIGTISNLQQGDFPTGAFEKLATSAKPSLEAAFEQQNPKRDYVMQYNLSLERQLLPNFTVMVAYVGSHGVHLPFRTTTGDTVQPTLTTAGYLYPFPVDSGTTINPSGERIYSLTFNNFSIYNGLEVQLTKRLSHGFQIQGSYTWSRVIDDADGITVGDPFVNSIAVPFLFDPNYTKGPADFNVSQNLTINFIWNVPIPHSWNGPAAWVARGWQAGGIFTARTGLPFTPIIGGDPLGSKLGGDAIDYPNRLRGPGCQSLVNEGGVGDFIKLNCFALPVSTPAIAGQCQPFGIQDGEAPIPGTCANLLGDGGRNEVYGPRFWNLDFSLFKNNQISEHLNLQFRAEVFNIFTHTNFQAPIDNSTLFNEDGSAVGGAGAIDATAGNSREIQFALKLIF
jgi:carboxypeptidase family protein/TonB-dependent receptor-like protein